MGRGWGYSLSLTLMLYLSVCTCILWTMSYVKDLGTSLVVISPPSLSRSLCRTLGIYILGTWPFWTFKLFAESNYVPPARLVPLTMDISHSTCPCFQWPSSLYKGSWKCQQQLCACYLYVYFVHWRSKGTYDLYIICRQYNITMAKIKGLLIKRIVAHVVPQNNIQYWPSSKWQSSWFKMKSFCEIIEYRAHTILFLATYIYVHFQNIIVLLDLCF